VCVCVYVYVCVYVLLVYCAVLAAVCHRLLCVQLTTGQLLAYYLLYYWRAGCDCGVVLAAVRCIIVLPPPHLVDVHLCAVMPSSKEGALIFFNFFDFFIFLYFFYTIFACPTLEFPKEKK
jgi:hypothetical protein